MRLQDWLILMLFNTGLIALFLNTHVAIENIYLLVVLWCFVDLIEIKSLAKIDVNVFMVSPQPFYKLFLNLILREFLSIKLISVLIASIYFSFYEKLLFPNLLLFLIFLLQVMLTILLYHLAYRYTKYATLIRYLYLTPFLILGLIIKLHLVDFGIDNRFMLDSSLSTLTFLAIMILTFCITLFFTNRIIHTQPFIQYEYLKKIKKANWHW